MKGIYHHFVLVTTILLSNGLLFAQSHYFQFEHLNRAHVDVDSQWTELQTGTHTFTKSSEGTTIEVYVNSRFGAEAIDANGVRFQVRVDGRPPTFDNEGSLVAANRSDGSSPGRSFFSEFLSIFAVFQNLPAGSHTVSIWARAPEGHATKVGADPGGWGGKIIVKEVM